MKLRNTQQYLMPDKPEQQTKDSYNIYPTFKLESGEIFSGYSNLADICRNHRLILIDGYIGIRWEEVIQKLRAELNKLDINRLHLIPVSSAFKSEAEIDTMLSPYLGGDDPIFGTRYPGTLIDFFDQEKIQQLHTESGAGTTILYGCGAFLCAPDGLRLYMDLPKNEIQFRSRAGSITNLGAREPYHAKAMYKRFYFVDWVVLNRHKEEYFRSIDWIIDGQREDAPLFMSGTYFITALEDMSQNYFRVRPWFEPGAWGGQYMKEKFPGLNPDVPNYAWSFELIVPENGIVFEQNGFALEVSFDFLMYHDAPGIIGTEPEKRFHTEFPIRIDYLDTMQGGNLSIQCHPQPAYIKQKFGENYTQDETYYMMDCEDDASVYLGLQDSIDPDHFRSELERSQKDQVEIDIEKFVQRLPAHRHDLFLIPHGTIHGSGEGNLVLEISSTPYIFTFKMYDWMRLDLDGKPRPINIERGFENINLERKGDRVSEELISRPYILKRGDNYTLEHLPTHADHFYDVHRFNFTNKIEIEISEDSCHVLVNAGDTAVELLTPQGRTVKIAYGETLVVPRKAGSYSLRTLEGQTAKILKVFIKPQGQM